MAWMGYPAADWSKFGGQVRDDRNSASDFDVLLLLYCVDDRLRLVVMMTVLCGDNDAMDVSDADLVVIGVHQREPSASVERDPGLRTGSHTPRCRFR